jgi:hypothetical protein
MPAFRYSLRKLLLAFFILPFFSCNQNSNDITIIKALDESLEASNETIRSTNDDILSSLKSKLYDQVTVEKAKIWYPKAQKTASLSNDMFGFINKISLGNLEKEKIDELYNKLTEYKKEILAVDSLIFHQFDKSIIMISQSYDAIRNNQKDFYFTFFKKVFKPTSLTFLKKLQNNIRVIENKILLFCHEKATTHAIIDEFYSPIAVLSSTYVYPSDKIEIIAGIGSFTSMVDLQIKINKKIIELNEMGYSSYKFTVSNLPGKYKVPVEISYLDQDGKKQNIIKTVEYTVAKTCE